LDIDGSASRGEHFAHEGRSDTGIEYLIWASAFVWGEGKRGNGGILLRNRPTAVSRAASLLWRGFTCSRIPSVDIHCSSWLWIISLKLSPQRINRSSHSYNQLI